MSSSSSSSSSSYHHPRHQSNKRYRDLVNELNICSSLSSLPTALLPLIVSYSIPLSRIFIAGGNGSGGSGLNMVSIDTDILIAPTQRPSLIDFTPPPLSSTSSSSFFSSSSPSSSSLSSLSLLTLPSPTTTTTTTSDIIDQQQQQQQQQLRCWDTWNTLPYAQYLSACSIINGNFVMYGTETPNSTSTYT
jgi:hypothetical protein